MTLHDMSPNVQEADPARRKRSFYVYSGDAMKVDTAPDAKVPHLTKIQPVGDCLLPPVPHGNHQPSPHGSPALTDAGSSTPARNSPSPQTPTKPATALKSTGTKAAANTNSTAQNLSIAQLLKAPKRKLTPAEKEARDKEAAERKMEREEQAAIKAAEKAKQEDEKKARAEEREEQAAIKAAEKAKQEEEKKARAEEREEQAAIKAAEKAKQEEEKKARAEEREEKRKKKEEEEKAKAQLRDEKKKKKEEEQRRAQEEKEKKIRSQKTLTNFFAAPGTPKKSDGAASTKLESPVKADLAGSPSKAPQSRYEKLFKPFFIKEHTRLARLGPQLDDEAREFKSRRLDEFIANDSGQDTPLVPFNAVDLFTLPSLPPQRGCLHHPVKHIMETVYKDGGKSGGAGGAEAAKAASEARKHLAKVPMKVIAFSQDVRPPYYGTMTFKPFALGKRNMYKLARMTTGRRLPLDYDYDSEAEWQEEEGEDLDLADDDEEMDEDEDFDGFLDDSEDAGLLRPMFANAMEPESTGICFENDDRLAPNRTAYEHKMEFIHHDIGHHGGIDPFSGEYWEPEIKVKLEKGNASIVKAAKMPPPPAPTNALDMIKAGALTSSGKVKLVKDELMNEVKKGILEYKGHSKVAIVEVLYHQFRDETTKLEMKNTIEFVAERKGVGRLKAWELKPGHQITA